MRNQQYIKWNRVFDHHFTRSMKKKFTIIPGIILVFLLCLGLSGTFNSANAQTRQEEERETDPLVLKNLEEWQDLKFGFLVQWGPYSQWEVVESWSLCAEDEEWCQRKSDNYVEYVKAYEELKTTFNPVKFNPENWSKLAKEAGMKYIVFTTKHHDGFCMYDTKLTDYKVTDSACPYHSNPRADITKEVFTAFRKDGFKIGAYFSKPDWNSDYYWWPYFATPDRHVNYDPKKYPDRWQKFKDFTYGQIEEIVSGYGKVDILWLDGGWVRPQEGRNIGIRYIQDVDMPKIATMARKHQPGLIIVDRSVGGQYENYRTPEQSVPGRQSTFPWETCMSMAEYWSYRHDDTYKSTHRLLNILIDIVSKGGNYLLNVGPDANGEFHPDAVQRMKEIGQWLNVNGEAIYKTRPIAPYKEGRICFTSLKDGSVFAIYLADEGQVNPPKKIAVETFQPAAGAKIYMLGYKNPLKWEKNGKGVLIEVPDAMVKNPPSQHAWAFKISALNENSSK